MDRQIDRSLSPAEEAKHIPQRRTTPTSMDENAGLGDRPDPSDVPYNDFQPSPRHHDESPELETTWNEWARGNEEEDKGTYLRYAREFPTQAEELGDAKTIFEEIFEKQKEENELPWAPFADKDEWELARWLAKNVNQQATEEFLKMSGVSLI